MVNFRPPKTQTHTSVSGCTIHNKHWRTEGVNKTNTGLAMHACPHSWLKHHLSDSTLLATAIRQIKIAPVCTLDEHYRQVKSLYLQGIKFGVRDRCPGQVCSSKDRRIKPNRLRLGIGLFPPQLQNTATACVVTYPSAC